MSKRDQAAGKAVQQKVKRGEVKNISKKIESPQEHWLQGCQRRGKKERGCRQ
jgi:hypothetical protein